MNINKAITFFESLLNLTEIKSEIKIYTEFIGILSDLKNRELAEGQLQSIEEKLDKLGLNSNPANRKKYLRKKLTEFKAFLKEEFSLISEGHYTAIGTGLGLSLGVAIGSIFGKSSGIGIGLSLGLAIGMAIGHNMDAKAKEEGRVLKTNP